MENRICDLELLEQLAKNEPLRADEMIGKMLMDEDVYTKDMFENLVCNYRGGNDDFRHGMDAVLKTLLWKDMQDIADEAKQLLDEEEEGKE